MPLKGILHALWQRISRGVFFTCLWSVVPAAAADGTRHSFDVPAGDATATLMRFGTQAKREIMFPAEAVAGVKTNALQGVYTAREALDRMVASTGLTVAEDDKTGALMIFRASSPKPPGAAPPEKKTTHRPAAQGQLQSHDPQNPSRPLGRALRLGLRARTNGPS